MRGSTVDVPTADGVADAYLTRPDDDRPHPGVLFIMDAIGLRPRIEEMADRIAGSGYVVLAPNVTDAPDSPHRSAGDLNAELYFGHADQDPSMTAEHISALDAALDDAGVRHRSEVYEGAMHGYTMSDMAAYNEAACERHFTELFALLGRALEPQS